MTNKRNFKTAPTPPFLLGSVSPPMFLPPLSDSWGTVNGWLLEMKLHRSGSWTQLCESLPNSSNFILLLLPPHTLPAPAWDPSRGSPQDLQHGSFPQVAFLHNISRVGPFHKMQPFRNRLSRVSPLRETAPALVPLSVGPQPPQYTVDPFVCQGTLLTHI